MNVGAEMFLEVYERQKGHSRSFILQ